VQRQVELHPWWLQAHFKLPHKHWE
jgi:hypothetical protein